MWRMVLRDLQWRRRRFVLALVATSIVFALSLALAGVSTSVHDQSARIVERFQADRWLTSTGGSGPFTSAPNIPGTLAAEVASQAGVERAEPVLLLQGALPRDPTVDVNIIGLQPGGMGAPAPAEGDPLGGHGEVVVDRALDLDAGDTLHVAGRDFRVAGVADDISYFFGLPTVFMTLEDAQQVALAGADIATAIVVRGELAEVPAGLAAFSEQEVIDDLERPLSKGTDTIDLVLVLLTIIAAAIVGLITYLTTLERTPDLAVLRATGSTTSFMAGGLAVQALLLSLTSAILSVGLTAVITPLFPIPLLVRGPTYAWLFGLSIVVGLVASMAGVWRAVRVDPALAFGAR